MTTDLGSYTHWLADARVVPAQLTPAQHALLQHAFHFRQHCGSDYYSTRLLGHFLLHCHSGLKVAQVARLLGIHRSTAVAHQGLASKQVVQAAHHRLAGRRHGKLLPRFAGPVAQFLIERPQATRYDLLDFIERTWDVRVSRMALHHFLKRYGLGRASRSPTTPAAEADPAAEPAGVQPPAVAPQAPGGVDLLGATPAEPLAPTVPVPLPPRTLFSGPPSTPGPSCCCPPPSTGSPRPRSASPMTTAPCGAGC